MRLISKIILLSSLATASTLSFAWGPKGHELVGAIAEKMIAGTPTAEKVHQILGMDLITASVWADCAKGVNPIGTDFAYLANPRYKECRVFETDEGKARMVDYVRRNWNACRPQDGEEMCHKQYHYTDVAIQHAEYTRGATGTSDHDIVAAISAAVVVLQGKPAPAPFSIKDQKEALLMLTHYVGDIHEPLHVGAVYLDEKGQEIDPKPEGFDMVTSTRGGNDIDFHGPSLHTAWDDIDHSIDPEQLDASWLDEARTVPATKGDVSTWSTKWANESLTAAQTAFKGVTFTKETTHYHPWLATYPDNYTDTKSQIQHAQLVKAGARLAQILIAVVH